MMPSRAERSYRRLLLLLPKDLRQDFQDEMIHLFARRLEEARGRTARALVWWRALRDLAVTGMTDLIRSLVPRRAGSRGQLPWCPPTTRFQEKHPMRSILKDVRYAVRALLKNPGFSLLSPRHDKQALRGKRISACNGAARESADPVRLKPF